MATTKTLDPTPFDLVDVARLARVCLMGTTAVFDIYNLVPAFNWIFDFVLIEGTGSNNLKWAVAVVIFTFSRLALTVFYFAFTFGVPKENDCCWSDPEVEETMLRLGVISMVYLGLSLPPWVAVRRRGWGDVLRVAGHGLDAGRTDIYWHFGIAVVVFWGLMLAICTIVFLARDPWVKERWWGQFKLRQTQKPQNKSPMEGNQTANQDVEKGGDDYSMLSDALPGLERTD